MGIKVSVPDFIPSWEGNNIYKERSSAKKGYSITWGIYNSLLAAKNSPNALFFSVDIAKNGYSHSRSDVKGSYYNTESKFIANQRITTLMDKQSKISGLFNFEKEPTDFEKDILIFFNVTNLNTVERTIPEKVKPDKNKPKAPRQKREVKLKPTHKYFNLRASSYNNPWTLEEKEVLFNPEEVKSTPKVLVKISDISKLNEAWLKKHKDRYEVGTLAHNFANDLHYWGITLMGVDDETFEVLIKDGQSWNINKFDFATYKKLESNQKRRDGKLKERCLIDILYNYDYQTIQKYNSLGVLPEETSNILNKFKEEIKIVEKKNAGFNGPRSKELQKLQDSFKEEGMEIKTLAQKFSFLNFLATPKTSKEYWVNSNEKTLLQAFILQVLKGQEVESQEKVALKA